MKIMKVVRSSKFWLGVIIVVQTLVYILAGVGKAYIHMDEAYSLALAQYDKVEITANEDFYDTWHTRAYYQDYLAVQEDESWDLSPVYENQKNDVHPPLFYFLLRLGMEIGSLVNGGEFSRWPGIILNVVIAGVNTVVMYAVVRRLVRGMSAEKNVETKALVLTAVAGLTVAAVSAVIYIRMYMLLTLFVMLTVWLHLKLYESEGVRWKLLLGVELIALGGVLTQYYYLFFLAPMWVVMVVKYIRMKSWKELGVYTGALVVAGVVSLLIWPWSIQHMFFGYRGQGVIGSLLDLPGLVTGIWKYVEVLDYNVFHRTLPMWLILAISCIAYSFFAGTSARPVVTGAPRSSRSPLVADAAKNEQATRKLRAWNIVLWPTVVYFVIVAAVSPFIELRYIMPITGLMTVLVIVGVYEVMGKVWRGKWRDAAVGGMIGMMMVAAPVQMATGAMRAELLYRDRQKVMELVEENSDAPLLYFITTENNRFLDNILPFAEARESYLALDRLEPTAYEVKEILAGKDLSRGLIVFVSSSQDEDKALEAVREATGLEQMDFIQGINTCDVYYFQ